MTDATWNPGDRLYLITAGCDNCYALRFAERFPGVPGHSFENGFDLTLRPDRLRQPLTWRRSRMIFVNSMSDLFHRPRVRRPELRHNAQRRHIVPTSIIHDSRNSISSLPSHILW